MPEYKKRFSFFESFYRASAHMTDEQRLKFFDSMGAFAFDGIEPELNDPLLLATWETVSSQITTSIKRCESGAKHGASKAPSKVPSEVHKKAQKVPSNEKKRKEEEIEKERNNTLLSFYSQTKEVVL